MELSLPASREGFTPELLSAIIGRIHPGASVEGMHIVRDYKYGEGEVSTCPRVTMELQYGPGTPRDFARNVVMKIAFDQRDEGIDTWNFQLFGLFENEVNFYNRIRPELDIEAPRSLGGYYDPEKRRYALILEDLSRKQAHFPTAMEDLTVRNVEGLIDTQARLHASLWNSPRFNDDLAWVGTHLAGNVETHMRNDIPEGIKDQIAQRKYKREVLSRLGTTADELFAGMCAVKQHQSRLPQSLLHGDCHVGNTYRLPDGTGGLLDFQLFVRGFGMHDVTYFINTALSVEDRRKHEGDLLAFYRDRLSRYGVADPPDLETLWREHRLACLWPLYIGWLTCPVENYGWEILAVSLFRVAAAFEDHATGKLAAELAETVS